MLNQLLRFTLVSSALLWLRPRWRGLLALTGSVLLIHIMHGEYLGYVELSGNGDYLVWSYVIKWVALITSVTLYVTFAIVGLKPQHRKGSPGATVAPAAGKLMSLDAPAVPSDDGFDFLRNKKRLESKADKVIAKR